MEEPEAGKLTAHIPKWINGLYIRTGPAYWGNTAIHFLDGYAMFTQFKIQNSSVFYNKKFLQSKSFSKFKEYKDHPFFSEFAARGCIENKGFFSRVANALSSSGITDNDSLNMFSIEGQVFAASESCHIHNFDQYTLETGERIDFYKIFGVHMACSHPLRDTAGDLFNVGISFTSGCKYQIMKIPQVDTGNAKDALKKSTIFATIYPSWNTCFSYFHSFAMTENFIVLIEQPLLLNIMKLADMKIKGKAIREVLEWCPQERSRFHVIDKRTGDTYKTKYYSAENFVNFIQEDNDNFFFHIANSYEDDGQIVIDIDAYPDSTIFDTMLLEPLRARQMDGADESQLTRFVLPIVKNIKDVPKGENLVNLSYTTASAFRDSDGITVYREEIGEPGFEGPTVSPIKQFKKHRYVFGSGTCCDGFYANALCKIDTQTRETLIWRDQDYFFPGEPEFLPSPDAKEDDEGIILSAVSDGRENGKDFLLFVDAKTMKEVSRAIFDSQIPQCVHGQFFPSKKMRNCFPPFYVTF